MNRTHTRAVTVPTRRRADSLIGINMSEHRHTAFIGGVGTGPANALYLITYDAIVLAARPELTWSTNASVIVHHFCNVTITEV